MVGSRCLRRQLWAAGGRRRLGPQGANERSLLDAGGEVGVTAQVDIAAGGHRVVSLMTREAAEELGLEPGVLAVAAVKSTNVVVELPGPR